MSERVKFWAIPPEAVADKRLKDPERRVLLALFSFRRGTSGSAVWPSRRAIAARVGGMHVDTVSRMLGRLAAKGWVAVKQTRGVNQYTLTIPKHLTETLASSDPDTLTTCDQSMPGYSDDMRSGLTLTTCDQATLTACDQATLTTCGQTEQTIEQTKEQTPPCPPRGIDAHSTSEASPQTDNPQTSAPTARPKRKTAELPPESFGAFWNSYPRKVAKGAAERAFAKIAPDAELLARMLAAVAAMERSYRADRTHWRDGVLDPSYLPHPATWLNARRWEDEAPAAGPVPEPDNRPPCHRPFPPDALDLPVCTPEEAMRHADRAAALMRAAVREAEAKRNLARGRR